MDDRQPSEALLKRGTPYNDSTYYFVENGTVTFDDEGTITSNFEVMYTDTFEIFVAVHTRIEHFTIWMQNAEKCQRLEGQAHSGGNIILQASEDNLQLRSRPNLPRHSAIFDASNFKVVYNSTEENPSEWKFEIIGFPFPKNTFQINFPLNQELELNLIKSEPENGRPIANLIFKRECVPDGWVAGGITDAWRNLISLALGRNVQWVFSSGSPGNDTQVEIEYMYRVHNSRRFIGAIVEYPDLSKNEHLERIVNFITQTFNPILNGQLSADEVGGTYGLVLHEYIDYWIPDGTIMGLARLMVTITEELLINWEENTDNPSVLLKLTSGPRKRLRKAITDILESDPEKYLGSNFAQPVEKEALKTVSDAIKEMIPSEIRSTLRTRLETFFEHHNHNVEELADRIQSYVKIRNAVVHTGKFPDKTNENIKALKNASMMMPLMVFCIFGYEGTYYDSASNTIKQWRRDLD